MRARMKIARGWITNEVLQLWCMHVVSCVIDIRIYAGFMADIMVYKMLKIPNFLAIIEHVAMRPTGSTNIRQYKKGRIIPSIAYS